MRAAKVVAVLREVATRRARCPPPLAILGTPSTLFTVSTFSSHTLDTLDTITLHTLDDTLDSLIRCIAFAMGQRERLGAGSRVRALEPEVVRMVLDFV